MSGIIRRTMLLEVDKRKTTDGTPHRPADWAKVITGIGSMNEPFQMPFARVSTSTPFNESGWQDMISRVDDVKDIDFDTANQILSSGDRVFSMNIDPRDGR